MSWGDEVPCPNCNEPLEFDEVDVGVGSIRGNYHCPNCGWEPPQLDLPEPSAPFPSFEEVDDETS